MKRRCYNCDVPVDLDPELATEEFKQRFEGEDVLDVSSPMRSLQ